MSPIINPDTSEAVDFSPIAPGIYPARIVSAVPDTSEKGNSMIVVTFEVTPAGSKPKERKSFLVISGKGSYNFEQLLRATGFGALADQYATPGGPRPGFDTDKLVNQELLVSVDVNLYMKDGQQKKGDQITGYLPK